MNSATVDAIPQWMLFVVITAAGLLAVEIGYRLGRWRHRHVTDEKDAPVAAMVASVLGLLAFMLAFTFSLAASRFDDRRHMVLDEANAIGTTWLRTRLLPEPQQTEAAALLREYAQLRVDYIAAGRTEELLQETDRLHRDIWSRAVAAAHQAPDSIMTGLFVQSLNEMIDLHASRVMAGLRSRIPDTIWLVLFSLLFFGMCSIGYQSGLSATQRSPQMSVLTLAFAVVLLLIIDLDRGHEGLLQVSQQPMLDLLETINASAP